MIRPLKLVGLAMFALLSSVTHAAETFITCQSDKMTLSVRDLEFIESKNGWKNYWAAMDYTLATGKNGTVDALVSQVEEGNGRQALIVSPMDPEETAYRKKGIEGGSVGFATIDSREKIEGSFTATWTLHHEWQDFGLALYNEDLSCHRTTP